MSPARINWPVAVNVAGSVAGRYALEGTYHEKLLAREAPGLVEEAGRMVEEETGLDSTGPPAVRVVGRREWVDVNVRAFSAMLEPAEQRMAERLSNPVGAVVGQVMAAEVGVLLGMLARRVLGQYDLVLPTGDPERPVGDTVMIVAPNVLWMERQHGFRPSEFRLWLALHECTHRLQFVGVPWMREYFLGLVRELVATAMPEPGRLARVASEVRESLVSGEPLIDEAGLLGLFASPEQRELIDRVQALMCLLEGHGHVVMDRVGERVLVSQPRMSRVLRSRREDLKTSLFFRLTGLEMKLSQYELGERFVLAVERQAGWDALGRAWEAPGALPTLDEIRAPARWLARVA